MNVYAGKYLSKGILLKLSLRLRRARGELHLARFFLQSLFLQLQAMPKSATGMICMENGTYHRCPRMVCWSLSRKIWKISMRRRREEPEGGTYNACGHVLLASMSEDTSGEDDADC